MPIERLRRRRDYRAVARGRRFASPGFVLQALQSRKHEEPARFGFTVTKKTGNAVARNRIRRRLKEAVRLSADEIAVPGTDYVLIGRRAALSLPFGKLVDDLRHGMATLSRTDNAGDRPRT
ncbi:ribonuclease P protein component [Bauldia sp.]|uniref:ribonuclease P protein component n=1 Tax=Bauldia sp. TaxID=2575872 RepID=UPI003BAA783D